VARPESGPWRNNVDLSAYSDEIKIAMQMTFLSEKVKNMSQKIYA